MRERVAAGLRLVARFAFGGLVLVSPVAWQTTLVERRIEPIYRGYTDFVFYASDLFALLTLGCWLLSLLAQPRPITRGVWFLTIPLAGLVVLSWLGVLTGIDPALTLYHSIRFTALFALYLFLVNESLTSSGARLAQWWLGVPLALAVIVQTLVALAQFFAQRSVGLGALGELKLNPNDTGTSIVRLGEARIMRAYGLTEHPNVLGGFLAFALLLLLGAYFGSARHARFLYLLPLALGAAALVLTFSRTANVAFVAGMLLLALMLWRNKFERSDQLRDLALAVAILFAAMAVPLLVNRQLVAQRAGENNSFVINPGEERSLQERDALAASAYRIFYGHALTGVGNGALTLAMFELDPAFRKEFYYQPAHLVLLDVAAELGVVGASFWLWLMVAPGLAVWTTRASVGASPWLIAASAALLALWLVGLFDYYPWLLASGRIWQWSAWGLCSAAFQSLNSIKRNV